MRYRLLSVLILLLPVFCTVPVMSQTGINVKSFKETPNDLDARVYHPIEDLNGKKCALVKVVTTEGDFTFDNGSLGVMKAIHKPELSEWWVYMPAKTMKLKIMHPVLGQLNDTEDGYYYFPNQLREATCYRMELTTLRKTVTYEQERVKTGFLIINTTPEGAQVYLTEDDHENFVGNTPIQKKLPYGTYNYRIKKSMYHDEPGVAVIDANIVEQNVVLRPTFGTLRVNSIPEGATVTFDNDSRTFTTPCVVDMLPEGVHTINIVAPNYAPKRQKVTIREGEQAELNVEMEARFAFVAISSLPGAAIMLNGKVVGEGGYQGELEEGFYDIEVSLAGHRKVTHQIDVVANRPQNLTLNPIPICGSLDVVTTPMYAQVSIDGKSYGNTPITIDDLLVGSHEVVLSKPGCATIHKTVIIKENEISSLDATLPSGCELSVTSGLIGDKVYVDNEYVGDTPYSGMVAIGTHRVELRQGSKSISEEINLLPTDVHKTVTMSWLPAEIRTMVDNMVLVEGGTFTMGATAEQAGEAYNDEKPVHSVTLSDFYICKYEVTQAMWKAVMKTDVKQQAAKAGYTDSDNRDNCPMYFVSYDEANEFCRRLSELSGRTFRLPTEAEWEYAARGGNKSKGYKFSGSNNIDDVAWFADNAGRNVHPVGTKAANELGICDMSGNVLEWCSDKYDRYSQSSQNNPTGPAIGSVHVLRGGCWYNKSRGCRVTIRNSESPTYRNTIVGFRIVCEP